MRIPRENLLNSVADVSPGGEYLSAIKNADQVIIFLRDNILFGLLVFFSLHIRKLAHISFIYVILAPEICSISSPFDLWSCNYCRQCCLHLQGNDAIFICGIDDLCLYFF